MTLRLLNLSLFILFPIAWFAPMARAGLIKLWFFDLHELSVVSSLGTLWETDIFLAILIAFFALIAPMLKTGLLAAMHFGILGTNMLPALGILGKLAMADVFLIALYIVLAKGVGVGTVETGWGLYLFTFCVLLSLLITEITKRQLSEH
ncbi:MAG TPA: paraquat-inducible membrane protein A [Rhodobacteraceae bacterium]|nr:paraquat-inducible membrane protein A [Paracoccaceae bacterium]